jgi:hypothetical protein
MKGGRGWFVCIMLFVLSSPVLGQSIGLSPGHIELKTQTGEPAYATLRLFNPGNEKLNLTIELRDNKQWAEPQNMVVEARSSLAASIGIVPDKEGSFRDEILISFAQGEMRLGANAALSLEVDHTRADPRVGISLACSIAALGLIFAKRFRFFQL